MSGWQARCDSYAGRLMAYAILPSTAVALLLLLLPLTLGAETSAAVLAVTAGLAALSLSALIGFDALLFRLMATHADEEAGAAAVDDILARMRLKPRPTRLRDFKERRNGTTRLVLLQWICLALFAVAIVFARLA